MSSINYASPPRQFEAKNAVRQKYGSPTRKLMEKIRENCRQKVKEVRREAFSNSRNLSEIEEKDEFEISDKFNRKINLQSAVDQIIRDELKSFDDDPDVLEEIFQEMKRESEVWLLEETERKWMTMVEDLQENTIFCPVCLACPLKYGINFIFCEKCDLRLQKIISLAELRNVLEAKVREHESGNCLEVLCFFAEPHKFGAGTSSLHTLCQNCGYFGNVLP